MATREQAAELEILQDRLRLVHATKQSPGFAEIVKALEAEAELCDQAAAKAQTEFQHTRATISASILRRATKVADDVEHGIQVMIEALREEFK